MSNADASAREALFRKLAQQLLAEPAVTQGTMMRQFQELKEAGFAVFGGIVAGQDRSRRAGRHRVSGAGTRWLR